MKQRISTLPLLVLLLLSTSCVPNFENALPLPKEMKPDMALLGTWESVQENEDGKSHVSFFGRPSGWIDIVFIDGIDGTSSTDGVNVSTYEAYTANVGKDTFLCLRGRKKDHHEQEDKESPYLLAHYHVSRKGVLSIRLFDQDAIKKLIEKGVLQGVVTEGNYTDNVTVTASSDEVASAIAENGLGAFISQDDALKFNRLTQ
jgi:hypothetical protein